MPGPLETHVRETVEKAIDGEGTFEEKTDPLRTYGAKGTRWELHALTLASTNSRLLADLARRLDELDADR